MEVIEIFLDGPKHRNYKIPLKIVLMDDKPRVDDFVYETTTGLFGQLRCNSNGMIFTYNGKIMKSENTVKCKKIWQTK